MTNIKVLFAFLLIPFLANAQILQDTTDIKIFELGEVILYSNSPKNYINQETIKEYNKPDVAQALGILPSVVLNLNGSRNESNIYMRGFDIHTIPVYSDGIPIYIPYDGYVDLARFTTADLSKIEVSKGFSSILYGPNAMGGTINLISSKPTSVFELSTKMGLLSGKGFDNFVSMGTRQDKFMSQITLSQFDRTFIPLSQHFKPTLHEEDFKRDNSYRNDRKLTAKIGFLPNTTDEYVISYINQKGTKGNPVYLGNDESVRIRYWQWPQWDKESIYFISKTALSKAFNIKSRLYIDQFKNTLSSFDDATFTSQMRKYAFNSTYHDKTYGGTVETSYLQTHHELKSAFHVKRDEHKDVSTPDVPIEIIDNTYTFGIEDVYKPFENLKFIGGTSVSYRKAIKADDANSFNNEGSYDTFDNEDNSAFNFQFAGQYNINNTSIINSSIAYKTRFATMKDRFSYRSGYAIPNPDLESEKAINIDLGVTFQLSEQFYIKPEIFSNHLFNTIQYVDEVLPGLSQVQNTGRSHFYGIDVSSIYQLPIPVKWLLNYSYIKRKNLSNPDLLFIDVPDHQVFSALIYTGIKDFDFNISTEIASDRFSTSYGNISKAYAVFNTRMAYKFKNDISAEFGINNIFDKNYTITEGFPEAGRNFFMSLEYNFSVQ